MIFGETNEDVDTAGLRAEAAAWDAYAAAATLALLDRERTHLAGHVEHAAACAASYADALTAERRKRYP